MKSFVDDPRAFWIAAALITLLRVATLALSAAELGPDEAQYWFWAQTPAFGYFSKPPLIAWAMAATTALFGDAAFGARLSAPLFHAGAAAFLYFAALRLYGQRAAFWTGVSWLTLPGVILSSFVIATDAPLLFFWSAGLYCTVRIVAAPAPRALDFLALGAAIGFGLLSKYAMIYFPAAMLVALISQPFREKMLTPALALTAITAITLFAPNIMWNSQHDFQTLSHTAANANWGASMFKALNLARYFAEQFVVFGIVPFGALCVYGAQRLRRKNFASDPQFYLVVFAALPILVVAAQAFLSRAHANWAAAAYPAALVFVIGALMRAQRERLAAASAGFHALILAIFTIIVITPAAFDGAFGAATKSLRGWKDTTSQILAQADGFDAVVIDDRYLIAEMIYQQRGGPVAIAAINPNAAIDNHYEAFVPFDPAAMKRVLFVTTRDDAAHVDYRFHNVRRIGGVETDLGGGRIRRYALYDISGYHGAGAPAD